ncbi:MAG: hypothetical protein N2688_00150 [Burkholderiaceae bacterium]|nr:hypothetical protein [Burkholderiaceae bacterium]
MTEEGAAAWRAAMACVAPNGMAGVTLDMAGTLALAAASGADVAVIAALLPDIQAGMMAGIARTSREAGRHG